MVYLLVWSDASAQDTTSLRAVPIEIREPGLVADYFAAFDSESSKGAVVVLGGSEGGLSGSRPLARALADAGFDAIAVSYFGEAGQLQTLDEVPIEPVGRAVDWLLSREDYDERIAVVGVSKGAELALLVASLEPRIRGAVAGAPSSVVWQGIHPAGAQSGGSWTLGAEILPYVAYDLSSGFHSVLRLYSDSLASAKTEATIPVERINGPILLVSASDDALWPAAEMSRRIQARLDANAFPYLVQSLVYQGAGHAVFGPPIAELSPEMIDRLALLGGTADGLSQARANAWPRVLLFLENALNPHSRSN